MSARKGGKATIIQHCAVTGKREIDVREFNVSEPAPYAQYKTSVSVWFVKTRKRRLACCTIVPDNIRFITIEQNGFVLYDSRQDVPCDMEQFKQSLRKCKAQHEQNIRKQEEFYARHPLSPHVTVNYGQDLQFDDEKIL